MTIGAVSWGNFCVEKVAVQLSVDNVEFSSSSFSFSSVTECLRILNVI